MQASSIPNQPGLPKEDLITDLKEGPWPGPIERPVVSGEVHFGKCRLPKLAALQIKKHRQRSLWYRTASAIIAAETTGEGRWDYQDEVTIKERGQGLFRGSCLQGNRLSDDSLELKFHDSSRELEHVPLNLLSFGMSVCFNYERVSCLFLGERECQSKSGTPGLRQRPGLSHCCQVLNINQLSTKSRKLGGAMSEYDYLQSVLLGRLVYQLDHSVRPV